MNDDVLDRLGGLAGVAFVVLSVVGGFIYPQQPRVDSAPAVTMAWVHAHRGGLQTGMILILFGAAAFVWFAAHLHHVLRDRGSERLGLVVFGAGIATAVITMIAALPVTILAFMDAQPGGLPDPTLVRMLGDLTTITFAPTCAMGALFLVGVGLATTTRCVRWLALAMAALNALGVWIGTTFSSYNGRAWQAIGWGAYLGFLLVILVVSAPMTRRRQPALAAT